jgi:hypothetical protein
MMARFVRRGGVLAILTLLSGATPAFADNCGSLSDCFFTIAGALAVTAALALLLAFLIGSGGTGLFALAGGGALGGGSALASAAANAAAAAAAAAAVAAAAGTILQMSSSGTPGSNQAQNKQFRDAIREAERQLGKKLDKDQIRQIHDEITGQNMGYQEIVETIISMFGG